MKRYFARLSMTLLLSISACTLPSEIPHQSAQPVQVYFNPNGGVIDAVLEIDTAKSEILVQAHDFTSAPIGKALIDARKRGVRVEVILDSSQVKPDDLYSPAELFFNAGIIVYIDSVHKMALSKMMIIDRETVITGTFNVTRSAEDENPENFLVIPSREVAETYLENWQRHRNHSEIYEVRR